MRKSTPSMTFTVLVILLLMTVLCSIGCGSAPTTTPSTTSNTSGGTTQPASSATTNGAQEPDSIVKLTALSPYERMSPLNESIPLWIDLVAEKTNGSVIVDWKGGPEVVAGPDQLEAVRTGAIDVWFSATSFYEKQNLAVKAMQLSIYTPLEEREPDGLFDYMVELHHDLGFQYLGRWLSDLPFYIFINTPLNSYKELSGRPLRSVANFELFFNALGINGVYVDAAETFSALERNIVQGFGFTMIGPRTAGWTSITKYFIDVPWWEAQNSPILMNLTSYGRLSDAQKKQIAEATVEYEKKMVEIVKATADKERQLMLAEDGVQPIALSDQEAKEFRELAYSSLIDGIKKTQPGEVDRIRRVTGWEIGDE